VKSIFICHQIALQAPKAMRFMNAVFLKLHLRQIHKFDALWIPDEENENNLSGILSHDIVFGMPANYIGIQSRFADFIKTKSLIDEMDIDILVVLSGPEPQRTYLEQELLKKLKNSGRKILLLQGKTTLQTIIVNENITTISYLNTNDLYTALQKAETIICRSGYSTVMDLAVLGKKAIFIPASGQTEQEYLSKMLENKGFSVECLQDNLNIEIALEKLKLIKGFPVYKTSAEKPESELDKYLA
jgi:UDP-N-acetylglucosamine transferase subunit ALG13